MIFRYLNIALILYFGVNVILVLAESAELSAVRAQRGGVGVDRPVVFQAKEKDNNETKAAPNCKKLMLVVAKRMLKVFNGCIKGLKEQYPTKEEASDHFQCAIKCFMTKTKMIDAEGYMTNSSLGTFASELLPPEYHPLYWKVMGGCHQQWEAKIDPKEEKCTSYGEVIKCLQDTASSTCV